MPIYTSAASYVTTAATITSWPINYFMTNTAAGISATILPDFILTHQNYSQLYTGPMPQPVHSVPRAHERAEPPLRYAQARPEADLERARIRQEAEQRERLAALAADELLKSILGDEAFANYKAKGFLEIDSPSYAGRTYQIRPGHMMTVMENKKVAHHLCIHPREAIPASDGVAAQLLLALYDEERLLRLANRHP